MSGLWRNRPETPEGKYLVQRRDGSIPEWPWFVLGANDPAAPHALRAYAGRCAALGMDEQYITDVFNMADEWEREQSDHGATGRPDAPPELTDDPETIKKMRQGFSA